MVNCGKGEQTSPLQNDTTTVGARGLPALQPTLTICH